MKRIGAAVVLVVALTGCASTSATVGNDNPTAPPVVGTHAETPKARVESWLQSGPGALLQKVNKDLRQFHLAVNRQSFPDVATACNALRDTADELRAFQPPAPVKAFRRPLGRGLIAYERGYAICVEAIPHGYWTGVGTANNIYRRGSAFIASAGHAVGIAHLL